jgi:glutamate N-acetyltransferase/amino-acid N-acetyltransferase
MDTWNLPRGFRYAGVACGVRPDVDRLDLALIVTDRPAVAAGVFTQNRVVAAPVRVSRERLPCGNARAIVVCAGNANACTGERGLQDARRMCASCARELNCLPQQVLVCSTGVIGKTLPMAAIERGIESAARALEPGPAAFDRAARAILTTDTRVKVNTRRATLTGEEINSAGFAKGAAMIGPNMATMLAFVLSDAAVAPADLATIAPRCADRTFNCISVEGHTSTNDSLLFLANGNGPVLEGKELAKWEDSVCAVCADLAQAIAGDAEGATHLVTIAVDGLRDDREARRVAQAVANSPLVKTAFFGGDPNWGRIVSAAGYAGVDFDEQQLSLWLGDLPLYQSGVPVPFDAAAASAYLKNNREILVRLHFSFGLGRATFWTCDLSYEYIRLNAEYTT